MPVSAISSANLARIQPVEADRHHVIALRRLVLRKPETRDMVPITSLADNVLVGARAWDMPQPYTFADAGRFLRRARDAQGLSVFAITRRETGALLGCCKLDVSEDDAEWQVGFWLGEAHWNLGYMTEAVQGLVDHAFGDDARLARLCADVQPANSAARRVMEKCGFQYAGPGARRDSVSGTLVPADRYRMDRGIWMALRAWWRAG